MKTINLNMNDIRTFYRLRCISVCFIAILLSLFLPTLTLAQTEQSSILQSNGEPTILIDHTEISQVASTQPRARAIQIVDLLRSRVFKRVPELIFQEIKDSTVQITFKKDCVADGLFTPPKDLESPLAICIRPDFFFSKESDKIVIHEFFHALHFLLKRNEFAWVREGLAQWFEFIVLGHFNANHFSAAVSNSTTPLEGSFRPGRTSFEQYGHVALFFFYLWSHCGGDDLLWDIASNRNEMGRGGIQIALENAKQRFETESATTAPSSQPNLARHLFCDDFSETATMFEVARFHNKTKYRETEPKRKEHFLASHGFPHPRSLTSLESLSADDSQNFMPILLDFQSGQSWLSNPLRGDFRLFWSQSTFPYSVVEQEGREVDTTVDSTWKAILIFP